jgi:hypothetical protein
MNLKPQDVVVALKLCAYPDARPAMSIIANDLSLSPSEVHGAIRRLRASRLLHGPNLKDRPNISALEEFLVHGLKYAFPAEHGEVTRGIPTSYAAEPLKSEVSMSNDLPPYGLGMREIPGVWGLNRSIRVFRRQRYAILSSINS